MYSFVLTKKNANELLSFLLRLPSNAPSDMKSLLLVGGAIRDLKKQNKPFNDKIDEYQKQRNEFLKTDLDAIFALQVEKSNAADDAARNLLQEKIAVLDAQAIRNVAEKFKEQSDAINAEGLEEVTMELSDDKFEKVKEIFMAKAQEVFKDVPNVTEILTDLGLILEEAKKV
jgi:hypothetical protein